MVRWWFGKLKLPTICATTICLTSIARLPPLLSSATAHRRMSQTSPDTALPPQSPTSPVDLSSSRRSSTASSSAGSGVPGSATATNGGGGGCDIESVGPNGEITWRRIATRKPSLQTEFPEINRRRLERLKEAFDEFDNDKDGFLGLEDLKLMMERLKAPQTHLGLKSLISEFSSPENSGRLDFRGFLSMFRKAAEGQLNPDDPLMVWYMEYVGVAEVNVDEVGVKGAKDFFQAKIEIIKAGDKAQAELRAEQQRKQAEEEAKRRRQEEFAARKQIFQQQQQQ